MAPSNSEDWFVWIDALGKIAGSAAIVALMVVIWRLLDRRPRALSRWPIDLAAAFLFVAAFCQLMLPAVTWETAPTVYTLARVVFSVLAFTVGFVLVFGIRRRFTSSLLVPVNLPNDRGPLRPACQAAQRQERDEGEVGIRPDGLAAGGYDPGMYAHVSTRYEGLVRALTQVVWTTDAEGNITEDSPTWRDFTGQSLDDWIAGRWLEKVHPGDRDQTRTAWSKAVATKTGYDVDYRLMHADGAYRWTNARAIPLIGSDGLIIEWVGLNEDITERKRQEAHLKNILRELSHRTKNLLAIIQSIARRTFGSNTDAEAAVAAFNSRLQGLSVSHDLLVKTDWRWTRLDELIDAHLEPFGATRDDRISVSGPDLTLRAEAAQNLGLALHELVTNAAKYGALSHTNSRLVLAWSIEQPQSTDRSANLHRDSDDEKTFTFTWREPDVTGCQRWADGFGTTLLERLVPLALLGTASYQVDENGVTWKLSAPLSQLLPLPSRTEYDCRPVV